MKIPARPQKRLLLQLFNELLKSTVVMNIELTQILNSLIFLTKIIFPLTSKIKLPSLKNSAKKSAKKTSPLSLVKPEQKKNIVVQQKN